LQAGDTLLLEAHPSFAETHRNSRDFFLISPVADSQPPRHDRAWLALAILFGMVTVVACGWMSMLNAVMLAAGLMIMTRCCSTSMARRSINLQVLVVIAAALGLAHALQSSGAAASVARLLLGVAGTTPWLALATVYGVTMLFTNMITNNAAAVLLFPIALETATSLAVSPMPFMIVLMIAASCGFATPIAYQTNLMVYGPGGYRFTDYVRFGAPLSLLLWGITLLLVPYFWSF
jgi:di/tricarboxylate transporter